MRPKIEKPANSNQRLQPTGIAKTGKTRWLRGSGQGLAHQDEAGWLVGLV